MGPTESTKKNCKRFSILTPPMPPSQIECPDGNTALLPSLPDEFACKLLDTVTNTHVPASISCVAAPNVVHGQETHL